MSRLPELRLAELLEELLRDEELEDELRELELELVLAGERSARLPDPVSIAMVFCPVDPR